MSEGIHQQDPDWPLGRAIRRNRERLELSIREAAKRAGISEGRWRQLESGYQKVRGDKIPIRTKPDTVLRVAAVVDLIPEWALETAGFKTNVQLSNTTAWPTEIVTSMRRGQDGKPARFIKNKVSSSGIEAARRRLEIFGKVVELMEQMTDDEIWELSEIAQQEWGKREEVRQREMDEFMESLGDGEIEPPPGGEEWDS